MKADNTPRSTPSSATLRKQDVSSVSFRNRPVMTPAEIPMVVSAAPASVMVAATTAISALKFRSLGGVDVVIWVLPPLPPPLDPLQALGQYPARKVGDKGRLGRMRADTSHHTSQEVTLPAGDRC